MGTGRDWTQKHIESLIKKYGTGVLTPEQLYGTFTLNVPLTAGNAGALSGGEGLPYADKLNTAWLCSGTFSSGLATTVLEPGLIYPGKQTVTMSLKVTMSSNLGVIPEDGSAGYIADMLPWSFGCYVTPDPQQEVLPGISTSFGNYGIIGPISLDMFNGLTSDNGGLLDLSNKYNLKVEYYPTADPLLVPVSVRLVKIFNAPTGFWTHTWTTEVPITYA